MKFSVKWALGLAILAAALLQTPFVWGQLRTRSGAMLSQGNIQHPKELERRIFQLTNEARRKNGLPPLSQDNDLTELARKYSDDMLKRHFFSHTNPDGKKLMDRLAEEKPAELRRTARAGENIASGSRFDPSDIKTTARFIVDGFMTSPGHRANILNPNYTNLGIGVSVSGKEMRTTQLFSQRKEK